MMKKIKIFCGAWNKVEKEVGEWLTTLPTEAKITHVCQNTDNTADIALTIFYTE